MAREEMVIFTRTFDLLDWLLPRTNHFPRAHRHTFTRRLLDAAFDLRERVEEANHRKGRGRLERLHRADEALARVRVYLRLAARWGAGSATGWRRRCRPRAVRGRSRRAGKSSRPGCPWWQSPPPTIPTRWPRASPS